MSKNHIKFVFQFDNLHGELIIDFISIEIGTQKLDFSVALIQFMAAKIRNDTYCHQSLSSIFIIKIV